MVRCDDDERIAQVDSVHRRLQRIIQRHGVLQRAIGIAAMVAMVNFARFHHQDIALTVFGQHRDRLRRHFGERRFF